MPTTECATRLVFVAWVERGVWASSQQQLFVLVLVLYLAVREPRRSWREDSRLGTW